MTIVNQLVLVNVNTAIGIMESIFVLIVVFNVNPVKIQQQLALLVMEIESGDFSLNVFVQEGIMKN